MAAAASARGWVELVAGFREGRMIAGLFTDVTELGEFFELFVLTKLTEKFRFYFQVVNIDLRRCTRTLS